jgi:hypothetical protein
MLRFNGCERKFIQELGKKTIMNRPNTNNKYQSDDPAWYYLAEYSLSALMPDQDVKDEFTSGQLFQTMREMGLSMDFMNSIELTLKSFAKEALANFKQGRLELPERVRIFCQKKMVEDARVAITSGFSQIEHTLENESIIRHFETNMGGGWGYFLIERRGYLTGSSAYSSNSVDLYLYKEGK